jgi:serine protease Do
MRRIVMKRYIVCLIFFLLATTQVQASDFVPRDIYKKASAAVVFISGFNEGKAIGSAGTGSIITADGLVLTNNHVIADSSVNKPYDNIVVCLKPAQLTGDGSKDLSERYNAEVVARNPDLDLAVLKIKGVKTGLAVIPIGDASKVLTGDQVAAIGHPEGGGLWILTTGTISGTKIIGNKETFQTEASTNRGNSGGPLLNAGSVLIGINTCMVRKADDGLAIVGVNFAVKSSQVKTWLNEKGIKVATATATASEEPVLPKEQPVVPQKPKSPSAAAPAGEKKQSLSQKKPPVSPDSNPKDSTLEDDFKEFIGANGQIMFGVPDGNFNLDRATLILFEKAKQDAEKSFKELDDIKKELNN